MCTEVTTHPEAVAEVDEAMSWLDRDSDRAAGKFYREYDRCVSVIRGDPTRFRPVYGAYRRLNMKRFNYAVMYRIRDADIYIIAVMHQRRHPDYWKSRVADDDG